MSSARWLSGAIALDLMEYLQSSPRSPSGASSAPSGRCCFSLWRAAFLLSAERGAEAIANYLEIVLRDNAVSFNTDRERSDWTVGYYLNNVIYRLADALDTPG
jgi:hypothetical protein